MHDFEVRTFPQVRQEILELLIEVQRDFAPEMVLMPTLGDIHQDHHTIAAEGLRAFKRTTILGYEIPWNQFSFAKQSYVVLEERHLDAKVRALECYRVAAAPQLRERGVHPQPRAHARHRDRPAVRRVLRSRAVGRVTLRPLRVLLTATGAPGAARLVRALQHERRARAGRDRHRHEHAQRRALPVRRVPRRAARVERRVRAGRGRARDAARAPTSSSRSRAARSCSSRPTARSSTMPLMVASPEAIAACDDKAQTMALAERAGVKAPRAHLARTPEEFRAAAAELGYPAPRRLHEAAAEPRARAASACSRPTSTAATRCSRRARARCRCPSTRRSRRSATTTSRRCS